MSSQPRRSGALLDGSVRFGHPPLRETNEHADSSDAPHPPDGEEPRPAATLDFGATMTATEAVSMGAFHVVTAADADGGLRLSLVGRVDDTSLDLRDVVVAALRSEPPRVEIDLRALDAIDLERASFLLACHRVAELLGVEYRVSSARGEVAEVLARLRDVTGTSADN